MKKKLMDVRAARSHEIAKEISVSALKKSD